MSCSAVANAQISGAINAFSPYTMYGIGDLMVGGNAGSRSMGALGVAMRNSTEFNYFNPASLSSLPRQSAVFNFSAVNSNYYQSFGKSQTSYNGVDLHDIGFAIPLYKGIGLGISLTPVSAVGYKTSVINNNQSIVENIGRATYSYYGEGGVSQVTLHFGAKVIGGLSLGATLNYNFGTIDRHWESNISSILEPTSYRRLTNAENLRLEHLRFSVGAQYQFRVGDDDMLTVGLVYMPESKTRFERKAVSLTASTNMVDTISLDNSLFPITMPEKISAGVYYNNVKFGFGIDYHRQNWKNAFQTPQGITLTCVDDFRIGAQFTPDRNSIRSFAARLTYKLGGRYATSYLVRDGVPMNEWAITAGVDIPLKSRNFSAFNIGVEYGQRGAINQSAIAVRENYFKVFFGLSLFAGDDMWFVKRKFH